MKTAILLCGQPRKVAERYQGIYDNLIAPNNADVYVHCWDMEGQSNSGHPHKPIDPITPNAKEVIEKLYKPNILLYEKSCEIKTLPINFDFTLKSGYAGGAEDPKVAEYYEKATIYMWHSIRTNQTTLNLVSSPPYDAVIRTRFDIGINRPLRMADYDLNYFYGEDLGRPELINNWLNFSSAANMEKINKINPYDLYQKTNLWCNEYFTKYQCDQYNIPVRHEYMGLYL